MFGGEEMEYTVSKFAQLSGVSARTLRYYDEIELLKPKRINSSGYRIYGREEVDLLQQILFYRELDFQLDEIKELIHSETFDINEALDQHLVHLIRQRNRLDRLIETVEKTIQVEKGECEMTDKEKFEAFKQEAIDKNEKQYGDEVRQKYGEDTYQKSKDKLKNITQDQWDSHQALTVELNEKLAKATELGDPESELAQEVAALHKEWLIFSWPDGYYDADKHLGLSLMYVEDPRFNAYYEKVAPGAAEFLHEALKVYLGRHTK